MTYSNGDDQVYSDSNQANSLRIGFELLHQLEGWDKYEKAMEAYQYIDEIVAEGKKNCLAAAKAWAEKEKDEPVFYVLASGPNYGVAYSMCCCISWRCSGSMRYAFIPENISTAPSRQRIRSSRWC